MTGTTTARAKAWNAPLSEGSVFAAQGDATGWSAEACAFRDYEEIAGLLDGLEGSVFQSRHWLSVWYEVMARDAGIEPFVIILRDAGGSITAALPLVRRREVGVSVLEFPDLGVSDYAAPLMRRASHARLPGLDALWPMLLEALPPADLLRFTRLAPVTAGMANPFYHHPWARKNRLSGWVLALPTAWDDYFATLSPSMKEKLRKIDRQYDRLANSERVVVTEVEAGLAALADLERMQVERIGDKGLEYNLDQPRIAAFYRRLIEKGLPSGETMLAVLKVDGETVAANFNVVVGNELMYLRVANQFGPWARHALGLVLTKFAIIEAQKRGIASFDFAMGNYDYKRRFGAVEMPLMDLVIPLSPWGWPKAVLWHLRHWAAQSPLLRRLSGRKEAGCATGAGKTGKCGADEASV